MRKGRPSKLEKPSFFRGLRWKLLLIFLALVTGVFALLGVSLGLLEYALLRHEFRANAEVTPAKTGNSFAFDLDSMFVAERENLKREMHSRISSLDEENKEILEAWLRICRDKMLLMRKAKFEASYHRLEHDHTDQDQFIELFLFDENANLIASSLKEKESAFEKFEKEKKYINLGLSKNHFDFLSFAENDTPQIRFAIFLSDDHKNDVKGGLFIKETLPLNWYQAPINALEWTFDEPIIDFIFFGLLGLAFGYPFVAYLSRRFERIAEVTHSWQKGDFSIRANENSSDEVGILARRLNNMANDLSNTFDLKQTIAASEERNRIARDLHDSVRQQVFGLAMQVSTAQALVEKDAYQSKIHLTEAENLIEQIQHELLDLINELSPVKTEAIDLVKKVRLLGEDWSRQNEIKLDLRANKFPNLSPAITQPLYRIVQEALANIARHSGATEASINLRYAVGSLLLSVSDDGKGIDASNGNWGFGLQNMKTRAEQLPMGKFELKSVENSGTTIRVTCNVS